MRNVGFGQFLVLLLLCFLLFGDLNRLKKKLVEISKMFEKRFVDKYRKKRD